MSKKPSKSDFSLVLASSVHDMKNSVGMLLTSLEELLASLPDQTEQQQQQTATLQYEASRINTELVQLLAIYRMQEKRLPVHVDEHYVIDVLEEQAARNDMLFKTRGLTVSLDCDEDLLWYFDAELVGSVIHNVLVNAARYSRSHLAVKAGMVEDVLHIEVNDDGSGYPQSMLENQQPDATSEVDFSSGNTQLGLYFAGRVAQMHHRGDVQGRISLNNGGELGGSVFNLFLP